MLWAWDERKAAANLIKHKVSFELAALVFDDPFHLSEPDPYEEEQRWRTIAGPCRNTRSCCSSSIPITAAKAAYHQRPQGDAA